jgi:ABC-type multidrug transport system fused ATPase/permease subunit
MNDSTSLRRGIALWSELLRLSWRREPALTAGLLGAHLLAVVMSAAVALTLGATVNATIDGRLQAAVVGAIGAALAQTLAGILADLISTLQGTVLEKVALTDLQLKIYRDLATLEGLDHLERPEVLDRVTVMRGSAWGLLQSLWFAVGTLFTVVQLTVLLSLLGSVSPVLLGLLAFAAVPVLADRRGQRSVHEALTGTAEQFRLQEQLFDLCTRSEPGKEVRLADCGAELIAQQNRAWSTAMDERFRARVTGARWTALGWLVFTLGFAGGLLLVVLRAAKGQAALGDIVITMTVAVTLRQAVHTAANQTSMTARGAQFVAPYLWLRDYVARERARAAGASRPPAVLRHGIRLRGVTLTYPGTPFPALDGIDLDLPAGSVVAVVGEYGSGKTTLVKVLAKFYRPDAGSITVDGTELSGLDTVAWRARMSAAFQDFARFQTLFREAVAMGDLSAMTDRDRILAAVDEADAGSVVAGLPDGIESQLGRQFGGVELSEGQWQRTALARASLRPEPLLFVLDEPTASLDAVSEQEIFERYMRRARTVAARSGAITLIVSHRFSTVAGADLIVVLSGGRVAEVGTHDDLLALGGRYADLYGIQATAYGGR